MKAAPHSGRNKRQLFTCCILQPNLFLQIDLSWVEDEWDLYFLLLSQILCKCWSWLLPRPHLPVKRSAMNLSKSQGSWETWRKHCIPLVAGTRRKMNLSYLSAPHLQQLERKWKKAQEGTERIDALCKDKYHRGISSLVTSYFSPPINRVFFSSPMIW